MQVAAPPEAKIEDVPWVAPDQENFGGKPNCVLAVTEMWQQYLFNRGAYALLGYGEVIGQYSLLLTLNDVEDFHSNNPWDHPYYSYASNMSQWLPWVIEHAGYYRADIKTMTTKIYQNLDGTGPNLPYLGGVRLKQPSMVSMRGGNFKLSDSEMYRKPGHMTLVVGMPSMGGDGLPNEVAVLDFNQNKQLGKYYSWLVGRADWQRWSKLSSEQDGVRIEYPGQMEAGIFGAGPSLVPVHEVSRDSNTREATYCEASNQ
ncbi:MAG: hypothetical protein FJZ01_08850 [Candidatus Sericytochromatia bacterium]|nr:hypothetical protein [Candidatus Tanganyikabacteria bacterium]